MSSHKQVRDLSCEFESWWPNWVLVEDVKKDDRSRVLTMFPTRGWRYTSPSDLRSRTALDLRRLPRTEHLLLLLGQWTVKHIQLLNEWIFFLPATRSPTTTATSLPQLSFLKTAHAPPPWVCRRTRLLCILWLLASLIHRDDMFEQVPCTLFHSCLKA